MREAPIPKTSLRRSTSATWRKTVLSMKNWWLRCANVVGPKRPKSNDFGGRAKFCFKLVCPTGLGRWVLESGP